MRALSPSTIEARLRRVLLLAGVGAFALALGGCVVQTETGAPDEDVAAEESELDVDQAATPPPDPAVDTPEGDRSGPEPDPWNQRRVDSSGPEPDPWHTNANPVSTPPPSGAKN